MRWKNRERSQNVQDRRGRRAVGGRGVRVGGGMAIVAVIAALLLGIDPTQILSLLGGTGALTAPSAQSTAPPANDEAAEMVSSVLRSTEVAWGSIFERAGGRYQMPQLILFSDAVQSACGMQSSATGPFYCPGDNQVYLDLGFLRELERLGARGDFAVAYVIAHEVGHHVQNLLGTNDRVRQLRGRLSQTENNALSVLVELQADCYAGVWAKAAAGDNYLDDGDIEEGLRAAASIGDDRLQQRAGRQVQPESFTHGSSEQRVTWFTQGYRSGDVSTCDTFAAAGVR